MYVSCFKERLNIESNRFELLTKRRQTRRRGKT